LKIWLALYPYEQNPSLFTRENREEEIRLYKKSIGKDSKGKHLEDSVDVSDRQPVFLKDKGDALYKQGNYR
jgi:dyslexia susceptibility 1 candidate gene 1 protein